MWRQTPVAIERETQRLIADDHVQKHSGIYPYILTRDEKHLNLRTFPKPIRQRVYEKQDGKCAICKKPFDIRQMEADHITPWGRGRQNRRRQLPDALQGRQQKKSGEITTPKTRIPKTSEKDTPATGEPPRGKALRRWVIYLTVDEVTWSRNVH